MAHGGIKSARLEEGRAQLRSYSEELAKSGAEVYRRNLAEIVMRGLEMLEPRERISIIEWAEENIILPDTTPMPGPFRIENSPHLAEILEAVADPSVRKITIMGSAQLGKTLFEMIVWAYKVVNDPAPMLIMQPTDREARAFAQQKLEPLIESSPVLKKFVADKKRGAGNDSTTRMKVYRGGTTEIISGTAKGTTRQRSVKYTMADDIDMIDNTITSEGDHVINLEKRTAGYKYEYLHINISTPRIEGESRVEQKYLEGSQGRYVVTCPHCGAEQSLEEEQLQWTQEKDAFGKVLRHFPETAKVACRSCGYLFSEKERIELCRGGKYVHKYPERKTHRSFWINQIMSTLSDLETVVREKIAAEEAAEGGDDTLLESYVNNTLGIPYRRVKGKETDAKLLIDRREDYIDVSKPRIPSDVLLITVAVDVQAGSHSKSPRLELEVWGWGRGEEAWILDKHIIKGEIEKPEVWQKLDKYFAETTFLRADGIRLKITRKGVDSGYLADVVYQYVANRFRRENLLALKGSNKYAAPVIPKKLTPVNSGNSELMVIGTQQIKHILFSRMNEITEPGRKYIHFTKAFCDVEYFEQLTAEHAIVKRVGLQQITIFVPKKRGLANEALDLLVMNFALMRSLRPDFEKIALSIETMKKERTEMEAADIEAEPEAIAPMRRAPKVVKVRRNFVTRF